MKLYSHDQMLDRVLGSKGTPARDSYEAEMDLYLVGEAIRAARKSRHLTQEQLGERIGVKKAQISRFENGKSITLSSVSKIFRALDIPVNLEVVGVGKVSL